jgi:hypothetical protein
MLPPPDIERTHPLPHVLGKQCASYAEAYAHGVERHFIEPGKSVQNAFVGGLKLQREVPRRVPEPEMVRAAERCATDHRAGGLQHDAAALQSGLHYGWLRTLAYSFF